MVVSCQRKLILAGGDDKQRVVDTRKGGMNREKVTRWRRGLVTGAQSWAWRAAAMRTLSLAMTLMGTANQQHRQTATKTQLGLDWITRSQNVQHDE